MSFFKPTLLALALMSGIATPTVYAHDVSTPSIAQTQRAAFINPKQVQMLFIDLQPSLANKSQTVSPDKLDNAASALAQTAKILNIPTTFALVTQPDGNYQQLPKINAFAQPNNSFHRMIVSPFGNEKLAERVQNNQRPILIIAGFTTDGGVLHATLDALGRGYTVYVVANAVGTYNTRDEQAAFREMEQAGAIITTGLSLVTRLAPDLSTPEGLQIIQLAQKQFR